MLSTVVVAAQQQQQTPPPNTPDPVLVTPGTIGFLATAFVVFATIFLIRDAVRRIRRIRARDGAKVEYTIPLRKDGDLEGQQSARPDWKGPESLPQDADEPDQSASERSAERRPEEGTESGKDS